MTSPLFLVDNSWVFSSSVIYFLKGNLLNTERMCTKRWLNMTRAERPGATITTIFLQWVYCYSDVLWLGKSKALIQGTGVMMYLLYNIKKAERTEYKDIILQTLVSKNNTYIKKCENRSLRIKLLYLSLETLRCHAWLTGMYYYERGQWCHVLCTLQMQRTKCQ